MQTVKWRAFTIWTGRIAKATSAYAITLHIKLRFLNLGKGILVLRTFLLNWLPIEH